MEQKKRNRATPVFWLLLAVFAIVNMLDSAPMWDHLWRAGGWYNTILHALLTLGAGPNQVQMKWSNIPANIGSAFPGIVFAVFPVLMLFFSKRGKKKTALIMSIINLLCALPLTLFAFNIGVAYGVCWLIYLFSSVLMLLNALGAVKNTKMLSTIFLVMGIVSIGAFVWLSCYRMSILGESTFVGLSGIRQMLTKGVWEMYAIKMTWFGGMFYPLSRAVLLFAFSVGVSCSFEPTISNCFEAKSGEEAKRYEYMYAYKSAIREEKGMFANVGGKIKVVALVLTWVGIIGSVIGGMAMISTSFITGVLTAVVGSLLSWVGSLTMYGFGELVENSDISTNLAIKVDREKSK